MSCHHQHSHGVAPIPTNESQSLNSDVLTTQVSALNIENSPQDLAKLFKTQTTKYQLIPEIRSDADNQFILHIPFQGSVKLYSIILRTARHPNHCPRTIKLYKNQPSLDFDSVGTTKATHEIEHPQIGVEFDDDLPEEFVAEDTFVEHYLPRRLLTGVTSLSIFFQNNWADDDDEVLKLYSVELRGEFTPLTKDPVVTLYESAANPADHKNMLSQETKNYQNL
ncbi:hypothetical protein OGAPHI_002102 [Ogataea philodendri]|uniref:PITH domain-containing protein n=1 Tax=Ogataea philodendri TaxID=1378263 RepID=A0A9P8P9U6_9ASCO|nr:uncharacterized protein OGAPHI_002102 [Ogataea philodendri]KAH3668348.1 hypothetical protein OGAPHI_002102 [Ogataea philodendri]